VNLFRKINSFFSAPSTTSAYTFSVKCHRCGEVLHGRANLNSEMSIEYDDTGKTTGYQVRKVLIGKERCFQQIEVTLRFDAKRNLKDKEVIGGQWVGAE
jgi:hypothetical protein